jgi:transposase
MSPSAPPPDDLVRAAERAYTGLPITLEEPAAEGAKSGGRRFSYEQDDKIVSGHVRVDGNDVTVTRLEIRPASPQAAVTSSMVLSVRIGEITASLRTLLALDRAKREGVAAFSYSPANAPAVKSAERPRRGGRPPVTDSMLRWVAEAYLLETEEGKPHPVARIAEKVGRPEETVRTWLARARREGWLSPGVRGRAGGEPGPKLIAETLNRTQKAMDQMQELLDRDDQTAEPTKGPRRISIPGHFDEEYMRQQGVIG